MCTRTADASAEMSDLHIPPPPLWGHAMSKQTSAATEITDFRIYKNSETLKNVNPNTREKPEHTI